MLFYLTKINEDQEIKLKQALAWRQMKYALSLQDIIQITWCE